MEIKKTITSIFMVPTLDIPKNSLKDNNFINGYIKDVNKEDHYEDAIYLLFKPKNVDKFREFLEKEYERTKSIIEDYDYEDGYVVVVYLLNTKFKEDYSLVQIGSYSKTSKDFQKSFPKTIRVTLPEGKKEEISLQYRIFNKTKDLAQFWEDKLGVAFDDDQELWHGFDEEEEVLDINKIKETKLNGKQ